MRTSHPRGFRQQVRFLRQQFLQDGNLPFTNVLSEDLVKRALTAFKVFWMDRIFSPLVTLWVFLGQVLSADSSCRAAVARLIAHRASRNPDSGNPTGISNQDAGGGDNLAGPTANDQRAFGNSVSHALE